MRKATPAQRWFTCQICEARFERLNKGRPPLYCSPRCRRDNVNAKRREIMFVAGPCLIPGCENLRRSATAQWCEAHYHLNYRNGGPTTTKIRVANGSCHHCGTPIGRKLLFCDSLCRRRFRMGAPGRHLSCVICDVQLAADFSLGSMYCSRYCKSLSGKATKYGLTIAEFRKMYSEADGCAICGNGSRADLVVDHCHASGAVRGLLCGRCNVGIGMLDEDAARLSAAIDYLQRTQAKVHAAGAQT